MENCLDPIASVRQGGAVSLAHLICANNLFFDRALETMTHHFSSLKDQSEESSKFGRLEPGPGQFGVVRRIQQDEDRMENKTMYSCGSLAPKMKAKSEQSAASGGCSACTKFTRDEEHWERADGSIVLLSELAKAVKKNCKDRKTQDEFAKKLSAKFDTMTDALKRFKHFEAHQIMHETACKQIPFIAEVRRKLFFFSNLKFTKSSGTGKAVLQRKFGGCIRRYFLRV